MRYALAIVLALILLACDKSPTEDNQAQPDPLLAGNNSATLTGEQVGEGQHIAANLRSIIPVTLQSPHETLELGQAYKARSTVDTTGVYWMVSVTNTGEEPLCGISAGGVTYLDAAGNPIEYAGSTVAKLYGNIGNTDLGADHSSLAPGETGWLLGYMSFEYDTLAGMRFSYLADYGSDVTATEARIVPQSYAVYEDWPEIRISVKNSGTWAGQLLNRSVCLLLYGDGTPLIWMNVDWLTADGDIIEAGETGQLVAGMDYAGASAMMKVYVDFEDVEEDSR